MTSPVGRTPALPSLAGAEWLTRPATQAVFAALARAGHEARAVGGPVRNALMGLPVTDIDIATTGLPEQTMAAARTAGLAAVPTGLEHGTITVVSGHHPYEVTTLRRDVATDGRRAVVAFTDDWAEDARRRDFTMNALYCAADGTVSDPLGSYGDLIARRVRFIGDARERIREDFLRILRFFRFHATYGTGELDRTGLHACVRLRGGMVQLSAERVGAEMLKLLAAPQAVAAVTEMFDFGLLVEVLGCAPRLPQFARLVALEAALSVPAEPPLRLAALARHVAEDADRQAERLRLSGEQRAVLAAEPQFARPVPDAEARVTLYRLGPGAYRQRVLLDWANSGGPATSADWYRLWTLPERAPVPAFPIAGRDLLALGMTPGPRVGDVLRRLEEDWIVSGFALDAEALKVRAKTMVG